jgi:molecular chaperone DnaK (HSP70)
LTKDRARFAIGIDLGTTNSALAFAPLVGEGTPEVLLVRQWEGLASLTEKPTLPSFLYLPEEAVAAHLRGEEVAAGQWLVGSFARTKASEAPGRVVHSAKSWLCHHAADRSAPFLPWGSTILAAKEKISPVRASTLILNYLRGVWNSRFAHAGFAFDDQDITVTVPASFDAAAQRLTITAAREAGFPNNVRLLEEPQAAFYCWLESHNPARELWEPNDNDIGLRHVLVIDIGGGTSDFSIFEVRLNEQTSGPDIRRVAVSEHTLLGGDNIDLALAHFLEPRLAGSGARLSGTQWDQLVAACRHLKERALTATGAPDERFVVALAGRGSGMIGGSQTAPITRAEIENLLLDGFFPFCDVAARPYRTQAALREWGLPYPSDSAITRHLAEFLKDRPRIDAVLFNGGSVRPSPLRQRLRDMIGGWQDGFVPQILENEEPDLAVARGAARFGALLHHRSDRIAAGAAAAIFLELERTQADRSSACAPLICVLPQGAAPSQLFKIANLGLKLRTGQLVRFQAYYSSRMTDSRAGDIVSCSAGEFHPLPPLQTIVRTAEPSGPEEGRMLPIGLTAQMNALGLLQVSCVSADPAFEHSWPLEFNMREQVQGVAGAPVALRMREAKVPIEPNASAEALGMARRQIATVFTESANVITKKNKITAAMILKSMEPILGSARSEWNGPLLRALWPTLEARRDDRGRSADHEEAWLIMAGFLLRPGFGVVLDDLRIDALWRVHEGGPCFPGRRIKAQEYILLRRVAGGLTRERQIELMAGEIDRIRSGRAPAELVRLAGSLELIHHDTKAELVRCFCELAATLAKAKRHCAPYLAALGLLLNRTPLYAGPETVVSPDLVEHAYRVFEPFDWTTPELTDLQILFLRAARVIDDRSLDLPMPLRGLIASKLEKSGIPALQTAKIKGYAPVGRSYRSSLYDESLPPGLMLSE